MSLPLTLFAGGLPGPVLFGFAIDHACLRWEQKCDGSTGACLHYDNHQMAWLLFAVCASCKVLNIVCGLFAWRMYVYKHPKDDPPQTRDELTTTVGPTGNDSSSTGNIVTEEHADQANAINNPAFEEEISKI